MPVGGVSNVLLLARPARCITHGDSSGSSNFKSLSFFSRDNGKSENKVDRVEFNGHGPRRIFEYREKERRAERWSGSGLRREGRNGSRRAGRRGRSGGRGGVLAKDEDNGGSGTSERRVCGILISDIPETSDHRTGEAASAIDV